MLLLVLFALVHATSCRSCWIWVAVILATLLNVNIDVRSGDQVFVLASTTGTGIDVFSTAPSLTPNLASLDLTNPFVILTDARMRAALFDTSALPNFSPLDIYQVVNGSPLKIGTSSGVAVPSVVGL